MRIGVLALQGAFIEHISALSQLEVEAVPVRLPEDLADLNGLIIPGGESTTISRLMSAYQLTDEITNHTRNGMAIMGTCAGMILMANSTIDPDIEPLGVMDMVVKRNAFGRQKDSFYTRLLIPALGEKPFPCIFIRAPVVERTNNGVETLASLADGTIVAVRQGKCLASSFHPELTSDLRFHKYFLSIAAENN